MQTILTGDRPTGKLHIGHYVGSLKRRVELQSDPNIESLSNSLQSTKECIIVSITRQKTNFFKFLKRGGHYLTSPIAYIVEGSFWKPLLYIDN